MRTPLKRVFRITINGTDQWVEPAGTRTVVETQHFMATEAHPGCFVRVQELYLGGAKAREKESDEDQPQEN